MVKSDLEDYLISSFDCDTDFPWMKYPSYQVFRHRDTKKWFALIMDVSRERLGLEHAGSLSIVNFKCDPAFIGSLKSEDGFFPAYHMNKSTWISVALDGSVDDDRIEILADMSWRLTS